METKMKEIIADELAEYHKYANELDNDKFTNAVLKSFTDALSSKHYVILHPVNLDKYFNKEQHQSFNKVGYYQYGPDERFNNVFFATPTVVVKMADILKAEDMCVELVDDPSKQFKVYVVTMNGVEDSHYFTDFTEENDSDDGE